MEIEIVVYGPDGRRQVFGKVDVYSKSWIKLPRDMQLDLDQAVLSGEMEFVLHKKSKEVNSGENLPPS